MEAVVGFLAEYGYVVIFAWVFADQLALPLPAAPLLIAAGAMAAGGSLDLTWVIALAALACVLADGIWYFVSRSRGGAALGLVCRLSIEPLSCVSNTKSWFNRLGPACLIVAKYVPGLQTLAPAAAGAVQMPFAMFVAFDVLGTLLWVLPLTLGGLLFHEQLAAFLGALSEVSGGVALSVLLVVATYLAWKGTQWVAFLRGLRVRRIDPQRLFERLQDEPDMTIIDLRQRFDFELLPQVIPGALRIPIDQISERHGEIPRERDVVLYCT
jgi:membrane protein DedA with SNARE-associated domain